MSGVDIFPDHEMLLLLKPSLVPSPPGEDVGECVPGVISAVPNVTGTDVAIRTYWGALGKKVYVYLTNADVNATGFDFVVGDRDQTLCNVSEYGTKDDTALGLIDGQNMLVEDPETIHECVEWTLDNVQNQALDTAYAISNIEPLHPPENRAMKKLVILAVATEGKLEVEV